MPVRLEETIELVYEEIYMYNQCNVISVHVHVHVTTEGRISDAKGQDKNAPQP